MMMKLIRIGFHDTGTKLENLIVVLKKFATYWYMYCQLGFSSKLKCPSSARLSSEPFQLGSAQLGKFQLKLITNHYIREAKSLLS